VRPATVFLDEAVCASTTIARYILEDWGQVSLPERVIRISLSFPCFRYDQLMDIGWKYMIPIGIGAPVVNAILGMTK
jgi:hypothetical protein